MAEDAAPPPPPPLSPPPALRATTIGKYIARFRYEKPQPREARVAAQRGDFWWTKSPRYARSPPPSPSTWASGDVFSFPDEDEQEEEEEEEEEEPIDEKTTTEEVEEKEFQIPQEGEGNDSSVDSVESKLRRRLRVWGSDSSREGEVLTGAEPAEVLQSWGSVEWGSVDLDEVGEVEEVEREDPEEVIERVRRRLGWGSTTTSGAAASTSGLKLIDFRLSIDKGEEPRRQLGRKPPLSPGSYRRGGPLEGFGARSTSSWGSTEQQRDFNGDEVKSSPVRSADDREPGMREEKVEEDWQSPVGKRELG
ncbi:hypothetical protein PHYSODRAFT_248098 [Phytophthora sojae]|uniref:Uncharacterized protein n=1 Tax=Phytophthora sojae (strain P6497) TaxID=1094619 RepID=G5AEJ5_PHYSP|nr:hypothetical protein PHYSODRAFT_248098 [Phytophthora sojae]EGZ06597.1 hypothetical protein PHYSODRAFT_248098 [Phytophthora sojae]|eukprot:XP_009538494.1 hypothetical protein PHYSODRAFT_248098 [Phytophthora sojae]